MSATSTQTADAGSSANSTNAAGATKDAAPAAAQSVKPPKTTSAAESGVGRQVLVWAMRAALVGVVIVAWWYITGPGGASPLILPGPADVFASVVDRAVESRTWRHAGITLFEILSAFALAATGGILIGFLLSRAKITSKAFEVMFAWGYMVPMALFYPLFLLWLGVGMESKIVYAAIGGFFPIAYNVMRGLRSVDQRYLNVGKAFGASALAVDLVIKAGAARPMILSGLRIGLSIVMILVVLGELLGANAGLGYLIDASTSRLQSANAYGLAVILLVITGTTQLLFEWLLRKFGTEK